MANVIPNGAGETQTQAEGGGVMDHNYLLYLHSFDVSGISLISIHLTGSDNYSVWSRSMRIALLGRNKLGLVDGSCKKSSFQETLWTQWERCNAIVLSWLMNSVSSSLLGGTVYATSAQSVWEDLKESFDKVNDSRTFQLHKEIVSLSQGTKSVSVYYTKLKDYWDEFEVLVPPPACDCEKSKDFMLYLQRQKLYQFLMGLNDTYLQAKSQILLMSPFLLLIKPTT